MIPAMTKVNIIKINVLIRPVLNDKVIAVRAIGPKSTLISLA